MYQLASFDFRPHENPMHVSPLTTEDICWLAIVASFVQDVYDTLYGRLQKRFFFVKKTDSDVHVYLVIHQIIEGYAIATRAKGDVLEIRLNFLRFHLRIISLYRVLYLS